MLDTDLDTLDAAATLAAAAQNRQVAEAAQVRELQIAAHWGDLHAVLDRPGPALPGCEQLVSFGGVGTPEVAEFCTAELGAILALSDTAARRLVAAALDLRHRLPRLWTRIQTGQVKAWVGRTTAEATRHLTEETVAVVDRRITPFADRVSWTRLEAIITAAWMDTDPDAAAAAEAAARSDVGVWVNDSDEHGIKSIYIKAEAPDVIRFDASVDRTADSLSRLGDERAKDVRRAAAIGILANPQAALDLFDQTTHPNDDGPDRTTAPTRRRVDTRPPVTLYVHLADHAPATGHGVARVEGIGPVTLDRVRDWLSNSRVTVKPVIDLNNQVSVDAYEIPDRLTEAVRLRTPVDCFPYATSTSRLGDLDHTIAYRPPDTGGPPGQTSLDNLAPLTRTHHRIKTHSHWQVRQVFNGVLVWRTPHGHHYLVDHTGTQTARTAHPAA